MTKTFKFIALLAISLSCGFAQLTTTSTTASAAITAGQTTEICLASATGISAPSVTASGTFFLIDAELFQVTGAGSSTTCWKVKRGQQGTGNVAHQSGALAWVGNAATGTGDTSRPFSGGAFVNGPPSGACTASLQYTLPVISTGRIGGTTVGLIYDCVGGQWGPQAYSSFWVSPTNCTFAPTTLTTTNTYIQVGASTVFVLNGTSNAAAGTNTLTCTIPLPTNIQTQKGAIVSDITLFVGSQTTAPTSLGTSTLGTIAFPAAATTEVASTVTPVAIGGTVTTTSPTLITTVTTAGSFLTIKHTYSTTVQLSADRTMLVYTMPFLQSAAAAMTLNTPGLQVHYRVGI